MYSALLKESTVITVSLLWCWITVKNECRRDGTLAYVAK